MVRGCSKKNIWFFVAAMLIFNGGGIEKVCASAGDKTVTGVVAKTGFGKIIISTESGREETYNTGRKTKYEPANLRVREGDKIEVTYYDKDRRGRTIQAVTLLKLIKVNPDFKEPSNPAIGTIKEVGHRAINIYIPKTKKAWKFEKVRGWKSTPKDWKPAADDKIKITYKRVPSRFSGGYVYQIKKLEKL